MPSRGVSMTPSSWALGSRSCLMALTLSSGSNWTMGKPEQSSSPTAVGFVPATRDNCDLKRCCTTLAQHNTPVTGHKLPAAWGPVSVCQYFCSKGNAVPSSTQHSSGCNDKGLPYTDLHIGNPYPKPSRPSCTSAAKEPVPPVGS